MVFALIWPLFSFEIRMDPSTIRHLSLQRLLRKMISKEFALLVSHGRAKDLVVIYLGKKFPGTIWSQWNDRFRITTRKFLKGDPGQTADLARRIYGSDDLFDESLPHSMHPFQSINYISSHDGLCLYDIFAYNDDGQQAWDCGWHGDDNIPENILKFRKKQIKNAICLLMLSNGVPMITMGAEFGQTQLGNNNPYNIDSQQTWLNWKRLEQHKDLFQFTKKLITFRKEHSEIHMAGFWRNRVAWYGASSTTPDWDGRCLSYVLDNTSHKIYVMINGFWEDVGFSFLQDGTWTRFVHTALDDPFATAPSFSIGSNYTMPGRSIAVFTSQ